MELTDNLKLPIPGPDDQGAVALYLETLARAADAKLGAYQDELNTFIKAPVAINVAQSVEVISFDFEYTVQSDIFSVAAGPAVVYNNFPPRSASTYTGDFCQPGWWSIGAAEIVSVLTSGTDNNKPYIYVLEVMSDLVVPGQTTKLFRDTRLYIDSSTGGDIGQITGVCYIPPDAPDAYVRLRMWHSQTATRQVSAGTVGWRAYLGSGDAAQKASL